MNGKVSRATVILSCLLLLGLASGVGAEPVQARNHNDKPLTQVSLQLSWLPQAQFAGYYAASARGFYKAQGLQVKIKPGGPDASVAQLVASGNSQFGSLPLGQILQARDAGIGVQNIAQTLTRPAYRLIFFKKSGIHSIQDLRGKRVGVWPGTLQLYAALDKYHIKQSDLTLVQQPFTMTTFLDGQLDAASATTYNELAQVIKAGHSVKSIGMIDFNNLGTGFLEDGLFSSTSYLSSAQNRAVSVRFLRASFEGWMFCRDHVSACVNIVEKQVPNLDPRLQTWMMNEINKLIWPNQGGVGYMPPTGYKTTADNLFKYHVLKQAASPSSYRSDLWKKAVSGIKGDIKGSNFKPLRLTEKYLQGQ